jgi:hypothetical protein
MKKIVNISIYIVTMAVLLVACRKEDNPKIPELTRFPLPLLQKVAGTDQVISAQNPASFSAKFSVDMYFKTDEPARKLDVVVIKNDNKTIVKTIKSDVTTYPSEIAITGPELVTLFGSPIVVGDKFDIGVNVTAANGKLYEAFPILGNSYASGVAAQPGASTQLRYEAVCRYNPNFYQGNFTVQTDEWGDYAAGSAIQLTKIDDTHFSFMYGAANPRPIVVTVNPVTNGVTVTKQVYGSGYPPGWTFGDISAESIPSINNFVAPCAGTFSVVLRHTVSAGNFGEFKLVIKKD